MLINIDTCLCFVFVSCIVLYLGVVVLFIYCVLRNPAVTAHRRQVRASIIQSNVAIEHTLYAISQKNYLGIEHLLSVRMEYIPNGERHALPVMICFVLFPSLLWLTPGVGQQSIYVRINSQRFLPQHFVNCTQCIFVSSQLIASLFFILLILFYSHMSLFYIFFRFSSSFSASSSISFIFLLFYLLYLHLSSLLLHSVSSSYLIVFSSYYDILFNYRH